MAKVWPHKAFGKKTGKWAARKKKGRGFKTFNTKAQAQAYVGGSKKSPSKKPKKPSISSTRSSNPSGGVRTTVRQKLGVIWRGLRTMLNVIAPAAGHWHYLNPLVNTSLDVKIGQITEKYIAYNTYNRNWDTDTIFPTYQGIFTSMVNDWFDRKTRKSAKISRGKIIHILTEGIPAFQAYNDAEAGPDARWFHTFVRSYNKYTDGYDMVAHIWDPGWCKYYAWGKIGAYAYDTLVPDSFKRSLNSAFPKGVNPF